MVLSTGFKCTRCGYIVGIKNDMRRHLNRKSQCKPILDNGILTDEKKELILGKRINLSTEIIAIVNTDDVASNIASNQLLSNNVPQVTHIINNNVQVNNVNSGNVNLGNITHVNIHNIIVKMDPVEKLNHVLEFNESRLIDLDEKLECQFQKIVGNLKQTNRRGSHVLDQEDLLKCVGDAVQINNSASNLNLIYDGLNEVQIYNDGEWSSYLEDKGIKKIIEFLMSNYLNDYEIYLLRKNYHPNLRGDPKIVGYLKIYYTFLCTFDIEPNSNGYNDEYLIGLQLNLDDCFAIQKKVHALYDEMKNLLKKSEKKEMRNKVLKCLKINTDRNIGDLNQALMQIIQIDEEYRNKIILQTCKSKLLVVKQNSEIKLLKVEEI